MTDHSECSEGGTETGYVAEYFHDEKWRRIPTVEVDNKLGVPFMRICGNLHRAVGVFSKHQACAIMHTWAARCEATESLWPQVRVAEYRVTYSFSVKRTEEVND